MAADPTLDELRRLAGEFDDFTFCYVRRNDAGRWVRDVKFVEDAGTVEVANGLFTDFSAGADVLVCGVLRGKVRTVDDFEFADDPDVWGTPYAARLHGFDASTGPRESYTVFGCWDTGDGFRRYGWHTPAVDAEHAELITRADKTAGTFLVAAVVEGCVPPVVEAVWATVDGEPFPPQVRRPWWRRALDVVRD